MRSAAPALVVLALVLAGFVAWRLVFPTPRFPEPTGPYAVGTRRFHLVDPSRPDPFVPGSAARELMVQVWYPAAGAPDGSTEPYLASSGLRDAVAGFFRLPGFLAASLQHAATHSYPDAEPAVGRFPVLLNPAGFLGYSDSSLFWVEELASHGYLVVGIDQPGTAAATVFPDGRVVPAMAREEFRRYMPLALASEPEARPVLNGVPLPGGVIPYLAQDLSFVLGELARLDVEDPVLAGHVDLERAGSFGVSLGSYVTAEACRRDERLKACLVADSGHTREVAGEGLRQPVMVMSRSEASFLRERERAGGWPDEEIRHTLEDQEALFARSAGDAYYLEVDAMFHVNWTDAPVLSPLVRWTGLAGPIDPYRGFALVNAYTVAFFDRYLKGAQQTLLQSPSLDWPEVRLRSRAR